MPRYAFGHRLFPWHTNKILIIESNSPDLPRSAVFCRVCGDVKSGHFFEGQNHHPANRGKMGQIEAMKSSQKVVKRPLIYYSKRAGTRFFLAIGYHRKKPWATKTGWTCSSRYRHFSCYPARKCFFESFASSVFPLSASCSFLALSSCCIRFISSTASSSPR